MSDLGHKKYHNPIINKSFISISKYISWKRLFVGFLNTDFHIALVYLENIYPYLECQVCGDTLETGLLFFLKLVYMTYMVLSFIILNMFT